MEKYGERIKKIEEQQEQKDKEMGSFNTRLNEVERDHNELLRGEIDRSEFYLRFQNVEEEKGENLLEIMAQILAELLEITEAKMRDGIDETFRIYTRYATRNKLPREIHIRFTKKSIKSQILQAARDKTLKYNNKDIMVLKQVPRRIRESRREYVFLSKELLRRGVNYRWLIPEGLLFVWWEQRHRINTVEKAELFYDELEELIVELSKEHAATNN
uniref:L1 transposable element RRM domain-containing protein n=1 Tax=Naja naja TaxID=35670 RepID=A0A8C6VIY2_NAJNA